jgi:hypothetical protein
LQIGCIDQPDGMLSVGVALSIMATRVGIHSEGAALQLFAGSD